MTLSSQGPVGQSYRVQPGRDGQEPLVEVPVEVVDSDSPHSSKMRLLKHWILPGSWFAFALFCQSVGLHVATYYYIVWMDRLRGEMEHDGVIDTSHENLSTDIAEGSLHDVIADWIGYHDIPMQVMDSLSLLIPLAWFCLVVWRKDLHCWTKCMVCGSLLALGKGTLAWVTVVPDSIGWKGCKARLGELGLDFFREQGHLNFEKRFVTTIKDIVSHEVFGFEGHHFRFCADMIYSGHTYFISLFGLGIWDLVRNYTHREERTKRNVIRLVVCTVLCILVSFDVILILMNRFHYTMDVILALVLVLLVYTNGAIQVFVRWWCESALGPGHALLEEDHLSIPPCCFPFCWLQGRYSVIVKNRTPHEIRGVTQTDGADSRAPTSVERTPNGHQYNLVSSVQEH